LSTTLDTVVHDFGPRLSTTIKLADGASAELARSTTTICANVATASQGETRREVLGSGDGRQAFQSFTLRQPPLTYLSADNASGLQSTLSVWVDEVQWAAAGSFQDAGPSDHIYVARDQDGKTVVQFGDGMTGARLPTGVANVRAVYRTGGDLAGRVRAGQLSLPMSRSGGVTGVTNPAASVGGDDPETVDSGRVSAPLRVTTIDRVVSLPDYALFARAFPGVAKAQAVWARAASHRGVLISVAGNHGAVLSAAEGIGKHLLAAIQQSGDPLVPAALAAYVPKPFRLAANVRTDPDRVRADVLSAVSARLSQAFSFEARDLGQSVGASEVLAEIQSVAGVVAATITALWTFNPRQPTTPPAGSPPDLLVANAPLPGADITTVTGAELLMLDTAPISWGVLP
jgi:predicted phage baseplate assembly protein